MYLNTTVKIPEIKGKIIFKKKSGTTYVQYQYGSEYKSERKYAVPLRVIVGKKSEDDPSLMIPNEKFQIYFPDVELPDELPFAYRSCCLIPASWYYEWEHLVTPDGRTKTGPNYMIQPKGCKVTYLAGLYRIEEAGDLKYPVFTVLTREPSDELRQIHDRMPLIFPKEAVRSWIKPETNPKEILDSALTDMVFEKIG